MPESSENPAVTKPLLIYDGDCSFCKAWVGYWQEHTGDRVEYEPSQRVAERFPQIPKVDFAKAVQLVLPGGERRSAAYAAFSALALGPQKSWTLWAYERVPGFAATSEAAYRVIAKHRNAGYRITKFLWGIPVRRDQQKLVSEIFLRLLGIIYFIAFVSFGVQARGLVGSRGIMPATDTLDAVRQYYGAGAYHALPTLLWIQANDAAIHALWVIGAATAILLICGIARRFCSVVLFVFYLSIASVGQPFMNFQWDALLLEAGFLAIFLGWSRAIVWLYRWLLFRLMFMSGSVKLLSHDITWRNFTALEYHYHTQPLPTPLAWYMEQLPNWSQRASTGAVLFTELVIPCLIFFPRRVRFFACWMLLGLQLLIFLTGNYAFFNLLTMALCLFLVDDARVAGKLPAKLAGILAGQSQEREPAPKPLRWLAVAISIFLFVCGLAEAANRYGFAPHAAESLLAEIAPFEIVNSYGLFAVMTTTRPEIIIEGSDDGVNWKEYEFKYKPGNVDRRPTWVEPHQPRLDWQMWFAALGNYREDSWIINFEYELLVGSPDVNALLASNPFPALPPRYLRTFLYQYRFTTFAERRATGAWWHRDLLGVYLPPLSLQNFQRQ